MLELITKDDRDAFMQNTPAKFKSGDVVKSPKWGLCVVRDVRAEYLTYPKWAEMHNHYEWMYRLLHKHYEYEYEFEGKLDLFMNEKTFYDFEKDLLKINKNLDTFIITKKDEEEFNKSLQKYTLTKADEEEFDKLLQKYTLTEADAKDLAQLLKCLDVCYW